MVEFQMHDMKVKLDPKDILGSNQKGDGQNKGSTAKGLFDFDPFEIKEEVKQPPKARNYQSSSNNSYTNQAQPLRPRQQPQFNS